MIDNLRLYLTVQLLRLAMRLVPRGRHRVTLCAIIGGWVETLEVKHEP